MTKNNSFLITVLQDRNLKITFPAFDERFLIVSLMVAGEMASSERQIKLTFVIKQLIMTDEVNSLL